MKIRKNRQGQTLLELLIVAGIAGVVIAVVVILFTKNTTFFQRMQVRTQIMFESRACMDTILNRLRSGMARTLVINTPDATSPPNSQVVFDLQSPLPSGATFYTIYLASGTVYAQEGALQAPKALASNVTGLMFTGNFNDPAIVAVTLRIDAPYDTTNDPSHVSTLIIPNQVVHMVESP